MLWACPDDCVLWLCAPQHAVATLLETAARQVLAAQAHRTAMATWKMRKHPEASHDARWHLKMTHIQWLSSWTWRGCEARRCSYNCLRASRHKGVRTLSMVKDSIHGCQGGSGPGLTLGSAPLLPRCHDHLCAVGRGERRGVQEGERVRSVSRGRTCIQ